MKLEKTNLIGIIAEVVLIILDVIFFKGQNLFSFLMGLAIVIGITPFIMNIIKESKEEIIGKFDYEVIYYDVNNEIMDIRNIYSATVEEADKLVEQYCPISRIFDRWEIKTV